LYHLALKKVQYLRIFVISKFQDWETADLTIWDWWKLPGSWNWDCGY